MCSMVSFLNIFKYYVLTVYTNSVRTIYAVPDDESIDSKHTDILRV
jgi:hypothetical protein